MKKTKRRPASAAASTGRSKTGPAVALAAAALILVTAILPAACGIDLLGTGRALGLVNVPTAGEPPVPTVSAPASQSPISPQVETYIADSRQFTLGPKYDFHSELPFDPPEAAVRRRARRLKERFLLTGRNPAARLARSQKS